MTVHQEVGQLYGVFVSHPAALLDGALLPDGNSLAVVGHRQTRPVGSCLRRTVNRLWLVPLGAGVLLGVVNVIDAADLVHCHIERQRILELFLGDRRSSLLHHRQVETGHRGCIVVGASTRTPVGDDGGVVQRGHLNRHLVWVIGIVFVALIDDTVAARDELHRLVNVSMTAYYFARKSSGTSFILVGIDIIAQVVGKILVEGVLEVRRLDEILIATTPFIIIAGYLPEVKFHPVFGIHVGKPVPGAAREFVVEIQSGANGILEGSAGTRIHMETGISKYRNRRYGP